LLDRAGDRWSWRSVFTRTIGCVDRLVTFVAYIASHLLFSIHTPLLIHPTFFVSWARDEIPGDTAHMCQGSWLFRSHILIGSRELVSDRKSATLEEQRENLRRTVRPRRAIDEDRRQKTVPRLPGLQAAIGLVRALLGTREKGERLSIQYELTLTLGSRYSCCQ